MKQLALVVALLAVAVLLVACDLFSSPPPADLPPSNPPVSNPPAAGSPAASNPATLPAPVGACQSRLWGKVTNSANGQSPANVTVEITLGSQSFKTASDNNGLYGFAGLCAGQYAISVTPPGGKAVPIANKATLDGAQPVKLDLSYK